MTSEEENKLAQVKGFTPTLDKRRGGEWCVFIKNYLHIWQIRNLKWQTALLINNHYCKHITFDTLEEAFERKIPLVDFIVGK